MTYARSRLWLGISSVGAIVLLAMAALIWGWPQQLTSSPGLGPLQLLQLGLVIFGYVALMFPADLLGGFLLPVAYEKSSQSFVAWSVSYIRWAFVQASVFLLVASLTILAADSLGEPAGLGIVALSMFIATGRRNQLFRFRAVDSNRYLEKIECARSHLRDWKLELPTVSVVGHVDPGFMGGVFGFGSRTRVVIPAAWLNLPDPELAVVIARRSVALQSGGYVRGVLLAALWNLFGFGICSLLPGAGLSNVSGLVTTMCLFTLWSFSGLLFLPTLSRNASLRIDRELTSRGVPPELVLSTASRLDQIQDDEPHRPGIVETIFHPIPNVSRRNSQTRADGINAWNIARASLFLSWACMGFLSRSVHCNVGRPELWFVPPTD